MTKDIFCYFLAFPQTIWIICKLPFWYYWTPVQNYSVLILEFFFLNNWTLKVWKWIFVAFLFTLFISLSLKKWCDRSSLWAVLIECNTRVIGHSKNSLESNPKWRIINCQNFLDCIHEKNAVQATLASFNCKTACITCCCCFFYSGACCLMILEWNEGAQKELTSNDGFKETWQDWNCSMIDIFYPFAF